MSSGQRLPVLDQETPHPIAALEQQQDEAVVAVLRAWEASGALDDATAAAPDPWTVARACRWISALIEDAQHSNGIWLTPHVVASSTGEIVFEWKHSTRLLTIYVTQHSVEYVQAWGTDINTEMLDGDADNTEERRRLWSWLTGR
jgi:hypothetical protein